MTSSGFESFRPEFPATEKCAYFDTAARGLMSNSTRAAIDNYLDDCMYEGGDKAAMFDTLEGARTKFATLINATRDEIAITKNVSEGLNAIGMALPWKSGDEIVLCSALEHPNNVYPWRHVANRYGARIVDVPTQSPHLPVEAMAARVNANTRLVVASSTTFAPGYQVNFEALSEACRRHGAFLLVDAVQSVGVMHTDVEAMGVDGLAVSTQKGLLGTYGFGFLYCRKAWAEQLEPVYLARFSVDLGDAHEASLGDSQYALAPGARRFDVGNYNYVGAFAVEASMSLLLSYGTRAIESYVRQLATDLSRGLQEVALPFEQTQPGRELANIVTIGSVGAGQHDSADDVRLTALSDYMRERKIIHSIRRGQIRLALHAYNNLGDVEAVVSAARDWMASHR